MMGKQKKKGKTVIVIAVIAAVLIAAAVILFVVNRWKITLTLNDDEVITVEYGDTYDEPGAKAFIHGSFLFKKGWPLDVVIHGSVDEDQLGENEITYSAEILNLSASLIRTVIVKDTKKPEIQLVTDPDHYTLPGHPYEEEGFSAVDNYDGDITDRVSVVEKDGRIYYTVTDSSGNQGETVRQIKYDDPIPPKIRLEGDETIYMKAGASYSEPGFFAEDNVDGDLTSEVKVTGSVDVYLAGTYEIDYQVTDGYGNEAAAKRTVIVEPVRQPDVVYPDGKIIYLTFDDGPGAYTEELLDVLDKYNVKATFFVVNSKYAHLIQKEAAAGHSVGVHTSTHNYAKIYASEAAFFEDFNGMQNVIETQTGQKTTLMRFPGGSSNAISKSYCEGIMTRLVQAVTDSGYQYFDWNVSSGDAGETKDTEKVFENVINGVQKYDVSVVLQHDIHKYSVDAVEKIIIWGLGNGYTFLPLTPSSPTAHHHVYN